MKYIIHLLAFYACQTLIKGLASHNHKGPYTEKRDIRTGGGEGMEEGNRK